MAEEGQAMVELAIVLPILVGLLVVILNFGMGFNQYLNLTDDVRIAARSAATQNSSNACTAASNAFSTSDPNMWTLVNNSSTGSYSCNSTVTVNGDPGVQVSASLKISPFRAFWVSLANNQITLSTSSTERIG
jgi:Flp pilus assembly protein TadG